MGFYQVELLDRAARELKPGEAWSFEMGSKEKAHSEYVQLKKEMKKKEFFSTEEKKCLDVSREGSVLIISMGTPRPYPEPVLVRR